MTSLVSTFSSYLPTCTRNLTRQVAFMARNLNVSVLGSSVAIFSGECIRNMRNASAALRRQQPQQQQQPQAPVTATQNNITHNKSPDRSETPISIPASAVHRIVRHPTDSIFLSWSLLFGCCIAHPSVLLRRSAVMDVGGYSRSAEPAEDYDLWLRLEAANPGCLLNTGEVCLAVFLTACFWTFGPVLPYFPWLLLDTWWAHISCGSLISSLCSDSTQR